VILIERFDAYRRIGRRAHTAKRALISEHSSRKWPHHRNGWDGESEMERQRAQKKCDALRRGGQSQKRFCKSEQTALAIRASLQKDRLSSPLYLSFSLICFFYPCLSSTSRRAVPSVLLRPLGRAIPSLTTNSVSLLLSPSEEEDEDKLQTKEATRGRRGNAGKSFEKGPRASHDATLLAKCSHVWHVLRKKRKNESLIFKLGLNYGSRRRRHRDASRNSVVVFLSSPPPLSFSRVRTDKSRSRRETGGFRESVS
jgi:hypothetical protein